MAHLSLSVLGPFQATLDGQPVTGFESNKVRALLAYLAVEADRPHPRESLAGLLWPDYPDRSALSNLRYALSNLREAIGDRQAEPPFLLITRDTIQFNTASDCSLDLSGLEIDQSEQVVSAYRGSFLEGFSCDSAPFEEWVLVKREQANRQMLDALHRLAAHSEECGEYERAITYARKQLVVEPWDEDAHRQLMRALALNGQRSAALAQYETCCRLLKQGLGVEPSHETRALYESIRDETLVAAQRPHAWAMEFARKALATEPSSETVALRDRIEQELTGGKPKEALLTNVPVPLTSFVGRQREMAEIKQLLDPSGLQDSKGLVTRLLTLTGAGGCGKTRLAIQVATDLAHASRYRHGVWWVELASLNDPALVLQTVARVFDRHESAGESLVTVLTNFFRPRELVLVLDNCEHLIAACAQLAETLLSACPTLQILATSREALGLMGEVAWCVPSLESPDPYNVPTLDGLSQYDAIRLLVERAQAVVPHWQLAGHAEVAVRICCRLDGIPLAIELAAARLKVLSAEQIAERLDDRFQLLTGGSRTALPRHRTLRATIDWSYNLLSEEEQALFRRLTVFAGGWTLDAVESVCCGNGMAQDDVLDALTRLVDKSMVVVDNVQDERRYRMLETIRQYTHEKLIESGDLLTMRDRHLDYFLKLAEEARPHALNGDPAWLDRLESENDNLRPALEHALAQDAELALRLAMSLEWFWVWHDHVKEGHAYAMRLLPLTEAWGPGKLRARALGIAGGLAADVPGDESARALLEASLAMARMADDKYQMAWSLYNLSVLSLRAGDWAQMRLYTEESLVPFRELGIAWGTSNASWQLGYAAYCSGEYESARSLFEQSLEWARKNSILSIMTFALDSLGELARLRGDYADASVLYAECAQLQRRMRHKIRLALSLKNLGQVALHEGDHIRARALFEEALAIYRQLERADCFVIALAGLAGVAGVAGKHQQSARLFGAAEASCEALGWEMSIADRTEYDRITAMVRAQLDEATFNAAWAEGRKMTLEQAIEYALKT